MSTFSTKGGLYERAQQRYGVADGKKLFTYTFFEKQRLAGAGAATEPDPDPAPTHMHALAASEQQLPTLVAALTCPPPPPPPIESGQCPEGCFDRTQTLSQYIPYPAPRLSQS